jgi:hypothetical protein
MKIKWCAAILLVGILLLSTVSCKTGKTTRLSISINGQGSVIPKGGTFPIGETVTLTATPKSSWLFDHWEGDASGSQNPTVITMDSNKVVTAYFLQYDYTGSDLRINTDALPAWVEGNYGTFTLDATGGTGTKSWRGTLPSPWVLSPSGMISGTAPMLGSTSMWISPPFTVTVIDEARHAREATYTIQVIKAPPQLTPKNISVTWDENAPPAGDIIYLATVSGGVPPYSMSFTSDFPPFGTSVDIDSDGVSVILQGPPTAQSGTYTFQISIVDSNNFEASANVTLTIKSQGTTISGIVSNKKTGLLEGGAVISIDIINDAGNDVSISAMSSDSAIDAKGNNYTIFLPAEMADTTLPANVILNCTKSGFKPLAGTVPNDNNRWLLNFPLEPISGESILIDSRLHHLGDNSYSGAVNSQFQTSAEGSNYSKSFTVDSAQLGFASATLSITHRGAQEDNPIMINGKTISFLNNSPADGSLGITTIPFDKSLLKEGTNTITITSVTGADAYDIDDFEFNDLYITFSN